jgi:hypothetical protein
MLKMGKGIIDTSKEGIYITNLILSFYGTIEKRFLLMRQLWKITDELWKSNKIFVYEEDDHKRTIKVKENFEVPSYEEFFFKSPLLRYYKFEVYMNDFHLDSIIHSLTRLLSPKISLFITMKIIPGQFYFPTTITYTPNPPPLPHHFPFTPLMAPFQHLRHLTPHLPRTLYTSIRQYTSRNYMLSYSLQEHPEEEVACLIAEEVEMENWQRRWECDKVVVMKMKPRLKKAVLHFKLSRIKGLKDVRYQVLKKGWMWEKKQALHKQTLRDLSDHFSSLIFKKVKYRFRMSFSLRWEYIREIQEEIYAPNWDAWAILFDQENQNKYFHFKIEEICVIFNELSYLSSKKEKWVGFRVRDALEMKNWEVIASYSNLPKALKKLYHEMDNICKINSDEFMLFMKLSDFKEAKICYKLKSPKFFFFRRFFSTISIDFNDSMSKEEYYDFTQFPKDMDYRILVQFKDIHKSEYLIDAVVYALNYLNVDFFQWPSFPLPFDLLSTPPPKCVKVGGLEYLNISDEQWVEMTTSSKVTRKYINSFVIQ